MDSLSLFVPTADAPLNPDALGSPEPLLAALKTGGYTAARLQATMGIDTPGMKMDLELVLRRVGASREPYERLVRLFLLAEPLLPEEAAEALHPAEVTSLEAAGLLVRDGEKLRSSVKIVPFENCFFVSDFNQTELRRPLPENHVLSVGPATQTLSRLAVPPQGGIVFDLGCGSGAQALLAARSADRVIGGDTNPRALNLAAFNAHLNSVANVEWRLGSFYEPVAGEKLRGLVANPPFVISPRSRFLFCDSELSGDGVSEHVIRHAAEHLEEGAFASILFNWYHDEGPDWDARPFSWCEGNGCDCWLLRSSDVQPLVYAANWLGQSRAEDAADYGSLLDEWLAYYQSLGAHRFCSGSMLLRKRSAEANWRRADTMDMALAKGHCGEQVRRVFANETLLQTEGEAGLLVRRWQVHPEVTLTQRMKWETVGWTVNQLNFGCSTGLPFAGDGDAALVSLLTNCQGERTLAELLDQLAADLEVPVETIRESALQVFAKLVRGALVMPVPPTDDAV